MRHRSPAVVVTVFAILLLAAVAIATMTADPTGDVPAATSSTPTADPAPASDATEETAAATDTSSGMPDATTTGVRDGVTLEPYEGRLIVQDDGAVIEGLQVDGHIDIKANDVTIRDVEVVYDGNGFGIRTYPEFSGTVIEHAEVRITGNANAAVMGGEGITVRNTEISGHGDGIKTTPDSTYEDNWIHLTLAEGSDKHLDGIQGGSSNVTIRGNVLWVPASDGGNAAYINTTFDETPPENITITDNWIAGGTFAVYVEPTKNGDCMRDVTVANNRFAPTHKWGRILTRGCDIDAYGNTAWDEFASAGDAEVIATD